MKKSVILLPLLLSLSLLPAGAYSHTDFHSWHKPINPRMASAEEMSKYRADMEMYLSELDEEIERLTAQKRAVISGYNGDVHQFNSDHFFHKEKIKPYKEKRNRCGNFFSVILRDDGEED